MKLMVMTAEATVSPFRWSSYMQGRIPIRYLISNAKGGHKPVLLTIDLLSAHVKVRVQILAAAHVTLLV